jgi:NAD(P)-dependent dehydrogenase (short-subunit alcohol dehydrogenase family)
MKTWLITGANRGLGLAIARAALDAGNQVVASARKPEQVDAALAGYGDRLLSVALDVTNTTQVENAVALAKKRFGRLDVLVNNAGYGQTGAFEENSADEIKRVFETNVFGVFNVTRAVLPTMREQRAGHVITISSLVGQVGFEGSSIYCSTKFALEGWSESLSLELARFGIKATLVEPGMFRTDFLDASSIRYGSIAVADYAEWSAARRAGLGAYNHQQTGHPERLGAVLVKFAESENPPVRFAAGSDALATILGKAETLKSQGEQWRELSTSTDYPA